MAPFTGGVAVVNATLISYAEACILFLLFGFWPGVLAWLIVRRVMRRIEARQPVTPYVHIQPIPQPEPELTFPGAERLKLPVLPPPRLLDHS